jgi:hypothetical protein
MFRIRILFGLLLVVIAGFVTGCATTDPENVSERPWNAPKTWEHGLPTSIMEGR